MKTLFSPFWKTVAATVSFLGVGYLVVQTTPALKDVLGAPVASSDSKTCNTSSSEQTTTEDDIYFTSCGAFF
jgi:hypothetical protein